MGVEDKRVNDLEWSVADVKQAIKLLTQLTLKSDERMDSLIAAQTSAEGKIAELAAAQARTEEAIQRLSTALEALAARAGRGWTASAEPPLPASNRSERPSDE